MPPSSKIQLDATGVFKLNEISVQKIERKLDRLHPSLREVGQRVRKARKESSLKRSEIANKLHCTERYLLEFELGAVDIEFGLLMRIAELVDQSVETLLIGGEATARQAQTLELARVWSKSTALSVSDLIASLG